LDVRCCMVRVLFLFFVGYRSAYCKSSSLLNVQVRNFVIGWMHVKFDAPRFSVCYSVFVLVAYLYQMHD
jgi:hypothetical protein